MCDPGKNPSHPIFSSIGDGRSCLIPFKFRKLLKITDCFTRLLQKLGEVKYQQCLAGCRTQGSYYYVMFEVGAFVDINSDGSSPEKQHLCLS